MAAIDDVELNYQADAVQPGRNHVRLVNTNNSRSVIVTISVTGNPNFVVSTIDLGLSRNYAPRQFEVRVAAGGTKHIGFDALQKIVNFPAASSPSSRQRIALTYTIVGAIYATNQPLPFPPPPTHVNQFVYSFRAPWLYTPGSESLVLVNLNHLYAVQLWIGVRNAPPSEDFTAVLSPMQQFLCRAIHAHLPRPSFFVRSATFFEWGSEFSLSDSPSEGLEDQGPDAEAD